MTIIINEDMSHDESRVVFRLEGFGKVTMNNNEIDSPDLIRECKSILEEYIDDSDGGAGTYAALALIDKYGGRILEMECGLNATKIC